MYVTQDASGTAQDASNSNMADKMICGVHSALVWHEHSLAVHSCKPDQQLHLL
jgi:hypothetical protein